VVYNIGWNRFDHVIAKCVTSTCICSSFHCYPSMLQLLFEMYSLTITMLHDFLRNLLISFPPYNAIVSHFSLMSWIALQAWWYIEWVEERCERGDNWLHCFFKGLKNMEIDISINDVEDLTHFQAQILVILWLPFICLGMIGPCTYLKWKEPFILIQY